ncbi:NADH:ubiquinone oxidoreductase [Methylomonas sp. SURF-2]|uniref:hydrogenase (acceptor) n=1 Tax=Methylomonas subterranea TaxID=2952225 RepID=A0ABT1TEC4_9GAMM|nr:NADH:ubiquinone oxidoreductase [Methylomonas sp. SURF-2]MCQ8103813.1 NADH:ubiquinone oxidoreductase [Methylomonas sp. SURF-2]
MTTLLWLQTGSCGGDTMSILCADSPSVEELVDSYGIEFLWQPSLSAEPKKHLDAVLDAILEDRLVLDILCVEGSIMTGPNGSGMYDPYRGRSKMSLILQLADKAAYLVAMGTCAAYGGVHAAPPNPTDCLGLQFDKQNPGGLLSIDWRSRAGRPVVNVSGCPAHPNAMSKTLAMLASGLPLELDHLNRPRAFFNTMVHQGCTRNEYHEYDVEDSEFGGKGCMFFNLGCKGPVTMAICNTELWNGRGSKTRAGVPCFGCTSADFPSDQDLFRTEKIGPIPVSLPLGVERANYMAYKSLAHEAAPERVLNKTMDP